MIYTVSKNVMFAVHTKVFWILPQLIFVWKLVTLITWAYQLQTIALRLTSVECVNNVPQDTI